MSKTIRAGVSFPEELLRSFDKIVEELRLGSRSRAIQEAMRTFISINAWRLSEEEVAGAILIHYSHDARGIDERLTDIQHEFTDMIPSALHLHLSKEDCLLIIAVRGKASRVKKLVESLRGAGKIKQMSHLLLPIY